MRRFKKLLAVTIVAGIMGAAGVAYAVTLNTPAEITSALTGKTVEDVYKERTTGKTFGTIAKEAGKLDEFKTQMLEQRKAVLDQRVKDGSLTQTKADEIYNAMKANQPSCDGTGNSQIGKKSGAGFGKGQGMGNSKRNGTEPGMGCGQGLGKGQGSGIGVGGCTNR